MTEIAEARGAVGAPGAALSEAELRRIDCWWRAANWPVIFACHGRRIRCRGYTCDHGDDAPEVRDWAWPH